MVTLGFFRKALILSLGVVSVLLFVGCEEIEESGEMMSDRPIQAEENVVLVGGVAPLSGDAAVYGLPMQRIVEIAKEKINEAGGINGKPMHIVWEDGMCNKESANKSANKLINVDGVKVIIGGFCSDETLGIASLAEKSGVIAFSPASSSPKITNAGDYIFRNWPSDSSQGKILAKLALDKGYKKVGVIYEQTDYALGIKDTFSQALSASGGEVVAESFASETADLRTPLLKLKGAEIDALFIDTQTGPKAGIIMKQLKEMDFKVPFLGNDVLMGSEEMGSYAEFMEGTIGAEGGYDSAHPEWVELQNKYREKYGEEVPYPAYMAATYDAPFILKEAIESAGYDADGVKGYLYGVKERKGVAGMLSIDENGDPLTGHKLRVVKGGKVEDYQ